MQKRRVVIVSPALADANNGNGQTLANWLLACRAPQTGHVLVAHLGHQCALRAPLFEPSAERAALHRWVQDLWTL